MAYQVLQLKGKVTTSNPNGAFDNNYDFFDRGVSKSNFQNALKNAVYREAAREIGLDLDKKLSSAERRALALARARQEKKIKLKDLQTKVASREAANFKQAKYDIVAKMFYRIVCRTPYDEDYYYTYTHIWETSSYKRRTHKATPTKGYENFAIKRKHTADNDVVKNDWYLEVWNSKKKARVSVKDFPSIDFENAMEDKWQPISDMLYAKMMRADFVSFNIFNLNPRVDQLEYGRYVKHDKTDESHKGEKRFHGTFGGYSVQAPRGFIGITEIEFNNTEQEAESGQYEDNSGEDVRWTAGDIAFNYDLTRALRLKMGEMFSKEGFEEKDILKMFEERKRTVYSNLFYTKQYIDEVYNHVKKKGKRVEDEIKKEAKKYKKNTKDTQNVVSGNITTEKTSTKVETESKEEAKLKRLRKEAVTLDDDVFGVVTINGVEYDAVMLVRGELRINIDGNKSDVGTWKNLYSLKKDDIEKLLKDLDLEEFGLE